MGTSRMTAADLNLPLSGTSSVVEKTLQLFASGQTTPLACAVIHAFATRTGQLCNKQTLIADNVAWFLWSTLPCQGKERKHLALRPLKPLRLIRDGEVGGSGILYLYLLVTLSPPEWFCIKMGSCVSHCNVSLIVWAKSQDSVRKPQFLKRREKGEPKRIEPRSFCLPAKRLTTRPHRLTLDQLHTAQAL